MDRNVTLQINLSPGDIRYAEVTVPRLIDQHRDDVAEVLLIVDCNRPGKTKIFDPDTRFTPQIFSERVAKIKGITQKLKASGAVDTVHYLEPDSSLYKEISKKYLRSLTSATHDYGGCALMAYLAGF